MTKPFQVKNIDENLQRRFAGTCKLLGKQQKECLEQAINDWLKKQKQPRY